MEVHLATKEDMQTLFCSIQNKYIRVNFSFSYVKVCIHLFQEIYKIDIKICILFCQFLQHRILPNYPFERTLEYSNEGSASRKLASQIANIEHSRKMRDSLGLSGNIIARYLKREYMESILQSFLLIYYSYIR